MTYYVFFGSSLRLDEDLRAAVGHIKLGLKDSHSKSF